MHNFIKSVIGIFIVCLFGYGIYFCFQRIRGNEIDKSINSLKDTYEKSENIIRKQYTNSCYEIRDAAKILYTESTLDEVITSGNVLDLKIYGKKPESGVWRMDTNGNVILENVIYDSYICGTVIDGINNTIDCKKRDK